MRRWGTLWFLSLMWRNFNRTTDGLLMQCCTSIASKQLHSLNTTATFRCIHQLIPLHTTLCLSPAVVQLAKLSDKVAELLPAFSSLQYIFMPLNNYSGSSARGLRLTELTRIKVAVTGTIFSFIESASLKESLRGGRRWGKVLPSR